MKSDSNSEFEILVLPTHINWISMSEFEFQELESRYWNQVRVSNTTLGYSIMLKPEQRSKGTFPKRSFKRNTITHWNPLRFCYDVYHLKTNLKRNIVVSSIRNQIPNSQHSRKELFSGLMIPIRSIRLLCIWEYESSNMYSRSYIQLDYSVATCK